MREMPLEPAVAAGIDLLQRAREIQREREALQHGGGIAVFSPTRRQPVIRQDWGTMLRQGVKPRDVTPQFVDPRELESLQDDPDLTLAWQVLVHQLGVMRDLGVMATLSDARGCITWMGGSTKVRDEADGHGFRCGAKWTEMGTNGIRLVTQSPIRAAQIYGPEHWMDFQLRWTCTAVRVVDPHTHRLLAVINLTGPWTKVHSDTLGWLYQIALRIEDAVRSAPRRMQWRRLGEAAGPLERIGGPVLVIDRHGVVVASHTWTAQAGDRVLRRAGGITPGKTFLPALGWCVLEPLPDRGWLVRPQQHDEDEFSRLPDCGRQRHSGDRPCLPPPAARDGPRNLASPPRRCPGVAPRGIGEEFGGVRRGEALVDAEEAGTIGRRLREIRYWRGKTLRVVAELAGITESHLSRMERGERPMDRRSTLEALATALQVAPSEITGQPYPPSNENEAVALAATQALRAVLRDIEVNELPNETPPRSLVELRGEVAAVNAACAACDYDILGQTVPVLIGELSTLAEVHGSAQARRLLADVLHAAFYLSKDLGHDDLAWMVSGHLHATAVALGEPVWGAVAGFVRSHATVGTRARERGLTLAERSTELVEPDNGPAGQVYGMLHLSAALASAVTGQVDRACGHVAEAAETASRTGDGTFAGLYFGPRNVGVWRVALAIELGEPGRVPELARAVDVAAIPSAGRQATFYGDVGRGLASIRGREAQAVEALRRAERLAPQRVRTSPFVRETVTDLMRRARRDAGGRELRGLAYRMGLSVD